MPRMRRAVHQSRERTAPVPRGSHKRQISRTWPSGRKGSAMSLVGSSVGGTALMTACQACAALCDLHPQYSGQPDGG